MDDYDHLDRYKDISLSTQKLCLVKTEAVRLGLEIDKDDSPLCFGNKPFALLLHGMQEKGSEAGEALKLIKRNKKLASV